MKGILLDQGLAPRAMLSSYHSDRFPGLQGLFDQAPLVEPHKEPHVEGESISGSGTAIFARPSERGTLVSKNKRGVEQ